MRFNIYTVYIKRLIDFMVALCSLILLSPILLIIATMVRIKLGSPIIFKQSRPGRKERIFYLYKFRSMTNALGKDGKLLSDAERLTKFGKILRASSLDELPELINIIRGDMSLIGPRPLSIYYLPHYPQEYRKRHDVRPGLTGLAQINGRNNLQWDERFALDNQYVENLSFTMDLKITIKTILKLLKHSDVTVRGTNEVMDYGPYCVLKEENVNNEKTTGMTYSEIGSYYFLDGQMNNTASDGINWLPSVNDSCFTFCGRSAIDLVIRDISRKHSIEKVFAPSYCCVSMLQSFIDREIEVDFYNVGFENGKFTYELPQVDNKSVVLIMSYFGLRVDAAHDMIEKIHDSGATIVEDITHSLLRQTPASELSDYLVASLRKWVAVPAGGWVGKRKGIIAEKPSADSDHAVEKKIDAMREKYDYLRGKIESKESFLLANAEFENDLIHLDRMLKIDAISLNILEGIDVNSVVASRRNNVKTLLEGLGEMQDIITIPDVDQDNDTLLFLPVFLESEKRDSLRKYLVDRGIYCPVHWPEVMGASAGIRANELSLICDQRYSEGDMKVIINTIHEWHQTANKEKSYGSER